MTQILELYEALSQAPDERARARIIAEAFEELKACYPHLPNLATREHLSETELRLVKEIEEMRGQLKLDIEQVQAQLKLDIEQVRADLKLELEKTRREMEVKIETLELNLTKAIERSRASVLLWSFGFWLSQFAAILAILWRVWPH